jgi:hypothetical protein
VATYRSSGWCCAAKELLPALPKLRSNSRSLPPFDVQRTSISALRRMKSMRTSSFLEDENVIFQWVKPRCRHKDIPPAVRHHGARAL